MYMLESFHFMEKICIKNMGVGLQHSFEKNKPQLCCFLQKLSLVIIFVCPLLEIMFRIITEF